MIHQTCVIGSPAQVTTVEQNVPADANNVTIGQDNVLREFTCVHAPKHSTGKTIIGNKNFIMSHCVINHDCQVGNNCILSSGVKLAGFVCVQDMVNIGMQTAVHQGVVIGSCSMIGMGSSVVKHVPPFCLLNPKYTYINKLNQVGLLRYGFSPEDIKQIKQYYRTNIISFITDARIRRIIDKYKHAVSVSEIKRPTYNIVFSQV